MKKMIEKEIQHKILLAEALGMEFYRCPNTSRIVEGYKSDDKVLCGCRRDDWQSPTCHRKSELVRVTAREYILDREYADGLYGLG